MLAVLRRGTRYLAARGESYNRPSEQITANLTPFEAYEFEGKSISAIAMHHALRLAVEADAPPPKPPAIYSRSAEARALEYALQVGDDASMLWVDISTIAVARPALERMLRLLGIAHN